MVEKDLLAVDDDDILSLASLTESAVTEPWLRKEKGHPGAAVVDMPRDDDGDGGDGGGVVVVVKRAATLIKVG